mgnify:CR=1 FL=1
MSHPKGDTCYEISRDKTVRAAFAQGYDTGYAHGKDEAPPVPPAGEVEVIQALRSVVGGINGLSWEYSSKLNLPAPSKHGEAIELVDRSHVARLQAENAALQQRLDRLSTDQ